MKDTTGCNTTKVQLIWTEVVCLSGILDMSEKLAAGEDPQDFVQTENSPQAQACRSASIQESIDVFRCQLADLWQAAAEAAHSKPWWMHMPHGEGRNGSAAAG